MSAQLTIKNILKRNKSIKNKILLAHNILPDVIEEKRLKKIERVKAYQQTEKGKEAKRIGRINYRNSARGKELAREYQQTEEYKRKRNLYTQTEEYKRKKKEYNKRRYLNDRGVH